MPKVTAYQCRRTKKLFADRNKFIKHLRKVRAEIHADNALNSATRKLADTWASIRELDNIPDIMQAFVDNFHILGWSGYIRWSQFDKPPKKLPKMEEFRYSVRYLEHVSISHSAPIGHKHNFNGHKMRKPYAGYVGSIAAEYQDGEYGRAGLSDVCFHNCGFNTGTGGTSGRTGLQYEFRMYLDDFPNLKNRIDEAKVLLRLKDADLIFADAHSDTIKIA